MIEPKHVQPKSERAENGELIVTYEFAAGEGLLQHDHACPHNAIVISGSLMVEIDGRLQRLTAGGVVTFPAGVMHALIAEQPSVVDTVFNEADAQKEKEQLL